LAIADLNGDGLQDIAVANAGAATVSVFKNTISSGTLSFATKTDFTVGTAPKGIAIGDIDGNGMQDIVVANSGSTTISVLRNGETNVLQSICDQNRKLLQHFRCEAPT
jgi:hypothetical protein